MASLSYPYIGWVRVRAVPLKRTPIFHSGIFVKLVRTHEGGSTGTGKKS